MSADPRPRGLAALLGVAAIGLTITGWLDTSPASLRAALVLLGAWVVPAYLLSPLVRRWIPSLASRASASFFLVLSLHAIFSELMRALGATFATYDVVLTWAVLLGLLAVLTLSVRKSGYRREWRALRSMFARRRGWLLAIAGLVVIAASARGGFTVEEDAYDHIGYVRRIADFNSMRPEHTLAMPTDATDTMPPDPRKGALHPAIAWVTSTAGVGPDVAWSVLPLFLYPALVFAFVGFTGALVSRASLVALAVALFMLSYGGTAFQFAHGAAYGQNLAAGWYWVLAALSLRGAPAALIAALAFGGALAHVGVALHAAILAASMVAFASWLGLSLKRALVIASILVAAAGLGAIVRLGFDPPSANILHAHVQGVLFVGPDHFVMSPMEILRQFGMLYLGSLILVPLVAIAARRRADARAVLALCTIPLVIAFVPPLATALYGKASYMLSRALLNAPVFAAAAIVLVSVVDFARRGGMLARVAAAFAVSVWALAFLRPALDAVRADLGRDRPGLDETLRTLAREIEFLPGDVILSDPATSYLLSAYCSNRFVGLYEQHANPRDAYALNRLQAIRDVISPFADSQRAIEACQRFHVNYVVLSAHALTLTGGFMNEWNPALLNPARERLRAIGFPFNEIGDDHIVESRRYAIFEIWPGTPPGNRPPDRAPPPVFTSASDVVPCAVPAPDHAFEITGIAISPPAASPGDSVKITLGYRRDVDTPFGLPSLLHVRFDHERLVEARSFVGDKYVRRFQERRGGYVSRLRADMQPGRGVFEPDLWPIGTPLREVFPFVIPQHALPGRYQVEIVIVRDSMLPNFHARDLLFNRDHYSGTPCASFEVLAK